MRNLFAVVVLLLGGFLRAQPPVIAYGSPQDYPLNMPVTPLVPVNTGGTVPPNTYGQVTTRAAAIAQASGIAVAADGTVYVTEFGTGAIKKITPAGVVSTIANISSPAGIALYQSNLYVSGFSSARIYKVTLAGVTTVFAGSGSAGSTDGAALSASFNTPGGLIADATGNIYVADQANNKIRKITQAGVVTTLAGSGASGSSDGTLSTASFNYPDGVAVDAQGIVYVADTRSNKIRKINGTNVTTLAGSGNAGMQDGTGASASFNYPTGITVDAAGGIYVADYRNHLIRKVSASGQVTTIAGTGSAGNVNGTGRSASFNGPLGLVTDLNGNLYASEISGNNVRVIGITGYVIDKALPAGLTFNPTTGIISGTPTVASPATDYTITAYNLEGSSVAVVKIAVTAPVPITFPPIPVKMRCDPDFDPQVTGSKPFTITSSNVAVATMANDGKIHITGAGTATITASNSVSSVSRQLTVTPLPVPVISLGEPSLTACSGAPVSITASGSVGLAPSFRWFLNGEELSVTSATLTRGNLRDGDVVRCIGVNNDYCLPVSSQPVEVAVSITPLSVISISITASPVIAVCAGVPVAFSSSISANAVNPTYQWYLNGQAITGATASGFSSTRLRNGDEVTCRLTAQGTCLAASTVTSNSVFAQVVTAGCVAVVPNTFTPNADGVNDTWRLSSVITSAGKCTVTIFNKNGDIVFHADDYDRKPWDGTRNGMPLPQATYYYRVSTLAGDRYAGSVTIVR